MSAFSLALGRSGVCLGIGQRMKAVDVAREIKVKTIYGQTSTSGLIYLHLSTFKACSVTHIQNIARVMFKYISGAGLLITPQRYTPLVTILVMS